MYLDFVKHQLQQTQMAVPSALLSHEIVETLGQNTRLILRSALFIQV